MNIVHVHLTVKPEFIDQFIEVTLDNARNSQQEPGNLRFDFFQRVDDPTRFVLTEIYESEEAAARHKETAHYLRWRETAPAMLAEERYAHKFRSLSPDESDWR
jgi:autoinducer 2-degrading protein